MQPLYAGIDAGGTSFKCIVGSGPEHILAELSVPVGQQPEPTLAQCLGFFRASQEQFGPLQALGVACFGPVDLNPSSASYGYITNTTKFGWSHTNIAPFFHTELQIPVGFDTDVNGALLAEARWGAGQGCEHLVYVTVGTGIGAGAMVDGRLLHGQMHPEAGHMHIAQLPEDRFEGTCPFHAQRCAEGLASGPALAARAGVPGQDIAPDNLIWDWEAYYLAQLCCNLSMAYSPQRIILGGGVMSNRALLSKVQAQFKGLMNAYLSAAQDSQQHIQAAALGTRAGALGALILAQSAQ